MANAEQAEQIDKHIELLYTYHLDLWAEVEAQLRVLRSAQDEIAKLREARVKGQQHEEALSAAEILARHVQTLKGRVNTLRRTVEELQGSVGELVQLLKS